MVQQLTGKRQPEVARRVARAWASTASWASAARTRWADDDRNAKNQ